MQRWTERRNSFTNCKCWTTEKVSKAKQWRLFPANLDPLQLVDYKYNYSTYLCPLEQTMMNSAPAALCRSTRKQSLIRSTLWQSTLDDLNSMLHWELKETQINSMPAVNQGTLFLLMKNVIYLLSFNNVQSRLLRQTILFMKYHKGNFKSSTSSSNMLPFTDLSSWLKLKVLLIALVRRRNQWKSCLL